MQATDVIISSEEITLGQFLKYADIIGSGGDVKWFLSENDIYVNGEPENRRGKKLRHGDVIIVESAGKYRIIHKSLNRE